MKLTDIHLGFVGFGHMAQVIFHAIDNAKLIPHSQVSFIRRDSKKMKENEQTFRITSTSLGHLVKTSDLILICVRPNQVTSVLQEMAEIGVEGKMIVSILAGTKISFFQRFLGPQAQILRVMPNLPSKVNEGMTLLSHDSNCSSEFQSFSRLLFGCMGRVIDLKEDLMDVGSAMAGSGPGFIFKFIEAMARFGEKEGMSYEQALGISAQTFLGAAKLIQNGGLSPVDLVYQIATPNGTTEAGFDIMRELQLDSGFQAVLAASKARSQAMGQEH